MKFVEWWKQYFREEWEEHPDSGLFDVYAEICAEAAWEAATESEREANAVLCETDVCYSMDIDTWRSMTKREHGVAACKECAKAIRARGEK